MDAILLFIIVSLFSCTSAQNLKFEKENSQAPDTTECSNIYPFQGDLINLDENSLAAKKGLPESNFKTCSKYAHRFANPVSDSVSLNGISYVIEKNKTNGIYVMHIFQGKKKIISFIFSLKTTVSAFLMKSWKKLIASSMTRSRMFRISMPFRTSTGESAFSMVRSMACVSRAIWGRAPRLAS